MTEIKMDYPAVLATARAVVAEVADPRAGWWRSWELPDLLARQLGIQGDRNQASIGREQAAVRRFDAQCLRAFNELAAEGTLLKTGRGERTPSGQLLGNEAHFYTPTAHSQFTGDRARELAAKAEVRGLWERVYDGLSDAGLAPLSERGKPVDLALPVWGQLLRRLD